MKDEKEQRHIQMGTPRDDVRGHQRRKAQPKRQAEPIRSQSGTEGRDRAPSRRRRRGDPNDPWMGGG